MASSKKVGNRMLKALRPYWRYEYSAAVEKNGKSADPFASLRRADARKNLVVIRGKTACLILNRFPYAPGHLMAIPYRATPLLEDLTDAETLELQRLIVAGKLLLQKVLHVDGINVGLNQGEVAGGSVTTHLHWHIVPRWIGDHNFMPVTGDTRILPVSQETLWRLLCAAYEKA